MDKNNLSNVSQELTKQTIKIIQIVKDNIPLDSELKLMTNTLLQRIEKTQKTSLQSYQNNLDNFFTL